MKRRQPPNCLKSRPEISQTTRSKREKNPLCVLTRKRAEARGPAVLKSDEERLIEKPEEKSKAPAFPLTKYPNGVFDATRDHSRAGIGSEQSGIISSLGLERWKKSVT